MVEHRINYKRASLPPRNDTSSISAFSTSTNLGAINHQLKNLDVHLTRQVEIKDEERVKFCKDTIIKLHQKQQQEDSEIQTLDDKMAKTIR